MPPDNSRLRFNYFLGLRARVVVNDSFVRQAHCGGQICQASAKPSTNIIIRHVMAALRDALSHSLDTKLRIIDANKNQPYKKPSLYGRSNKDEGSAPRKMPSKSRKRMILLLPEPFGPAKP
jgi:hypothetical protein